MHNNYLNRNKFSTLLPVSTIQLGIKPEAEYQTDCLNLPTKSFTKVEIEF